MDFMNKHTLILLVLVERCLRLCLLLAHERTSVRVKVIVLIGGTAIVSIWLLLLGLLMRLLEGRLEQLRLDPAHVVVTRVQRVQRRVDLAELRLSTVRVRRLLLRRLLVRVHPTRRAEWVRTVLQIHGRVEG